jgi:hypothetical protein
MLPALPAEVRDITPLETMLLVMRSAIAEGDCPVMLAAASAAAPYLHPKLAAAEVRVTHKAVAAMSDEELKAEIALLEARIKAAETLN